MNNGEPYLIAAYVMSVVLLWGYAALLWVGWRGIDRRQGNES